MAASGATPIVLFNSGTTGHTPTTANLVVGELAINYTDGNLFYNNGTIIKSFTPAMLAATSGTINGVTIGATTPSTGAFTTLSASSTVSGTTITASTQFSGPGTGLSGTATVLSIGGNAATATTATTALAVTGVTNGSNASAGQVGEYITLGGTQGSAASGVTYQLIAFTLPAGDWDVFGQYAMANTGSTAFTFGQFGIGSTSTSFDLTNVLRPSITGNGFDYGALPMLRVSTNTSKTIYANGGVGFTGSVPSISMTLQARRVR